LLNENEEKNYAATGQVRGAPYFLTANHSRKLYRILVIYSFHVKVIHLDNERATIRKESNSCCLQTLRWLNIKQKHGWQTKPRASLHKHFRHNYKNRMNCISLPFWVRTGVPDERVPATDNGLAIVDILKLYSC